MQKWEYTSIFWSGTKIFIGSDLVADNKNALPLTYMQQLGEQGWEMVTAVSESVSICVGGNAWAKEQWGGFKDGTLNVKSLDGKKPPNKACSGLAGFCGIYKHFSGFGLSLLSNIFPARPPTTNANR